MRRAPQVFTLDGAGNATCDYGQMSSLLLITVARLSEAGAPTKKFCEWRLSIVALSRLWDTCLEIISRRTEAELTALRLSASDSPTGQRGGLVVALRALRLAPGDIFVDIGCGDGILMSLMKKNID